MRSTCYFIGIANYVKLNINNGILDGINSKFKLSRELQKDLDMLKFSKNSSVLFSPILNTK